MGYIRQLAGQTMVYGLGIVVPRLLNYILLTPFYTRIFDQSQYGVVTELYAYVVFLLVVLTYGMETGFFRFADKNHNADDVYKTSLISLFSSSLVFVLLILIFIRPVSSAIGYEDSKSYIQYIAIIVGIDAFTSIPFARIRLRSKALRYALIRVAEVLMNITANWFFLYYCPANYENSEFLAAVYNPEIGVGYVFISNLLASILKLLLLLPDIFIIRGVFNFALLKSMLLYSYPLLIAGLAGTINEALDRVLLKHLIAENPMAQLGIYGANYKLAVLMTLFIQMFRFAAEPFYFKRKDEHNAREVYADIMNYFVFCSMMIYMLVILFLPQFSLFIGPDFREGVFVVPVILLANVFMGIFYNLSIWYKLSGKTFYGAWFVAVGALLTIFINIIFIPRFGYLASAWGHLVSYLAMVILCYYFGQKNYTIGYNLRKLSVFIILPLVLTGVNKIIPAQNDILNIILNLTFLFLYLLVFIRIQNLKLLKIWKLKS